MPVGTELPVGTAGPVRAARAFRAARPVRTESPVRTELVEVLAQGFDKLSPNGFIANGSLTNRLLANAGRGHGPRMLS